VAAVEAVQVHQHQHTVGKTEVLVVEEMTLKVLTEVLFPQHKVSTVEQV
tara:strand:- start:1190 stop:1336 length:147 start_codon:yes stop_codon:yes gene_type:complete